MPARARPCRASSRRAPGALAAALAGRCHLPAPTCRCSPVTALPADVALSGRSRFFAALPPQVVTHLQTRPYAMENHAHGGLELLCVLACPVEAQGLNGCTAACARTGGKAALQPRRAWPGAPGTPPAGPCCPTPCAGLAWTAIEENPRMRDFFHVTSLSVDRVGQVGGCSGVPGGCAGAGAKRRRATPLPSRRPLPLMPRHRAAPAVPTRQVYVSTMEGKEHPVFATQWCARARARGHVSPCLASRAPSARAGQLLGPATGLQPRQQSGCPRALPLVGAHRRTRARAGPRHGQQCCLPLCASCCCRSFTPRPTQAPREERVRVDARQGHPAPPRRHRGHAGARDQWQGGLLLGAAAAAAAAGCCCVARQVGGAAAAAAAAGRAARCWARRPPAAPDAESGMRRASRQAGPPALQLPPLCSLLPSQVVANFFAGRPTSRSRLALPLPATHLPHSRPPRRNRRWPTSSWARRGATGTRRAASRRRRAC